MASLPFRHFAPVQVIGFMKQKGHIMWLGFGHSIVRLVSTLFIVSGLIVLGLTSAYYVYAWYNEQAFDPASYSSSSADYGRDASESDGSSVPTPAAEGLEAQSLAIAQEPTFFPVAEPVEVKAAPPAERPPADWIYIPGIKVDSKVVELGTKIEKGEVVWETPNKVVGHAKGTGTPGGPGNIVMYGHISSPLKGEGSIFKRLPELKVGDGVYLYVGETEFHYQVIETRVVLPSDTWVMDPTPDETLTLITCVPDYVYTYRLIVTAKRAP